MLSRKLMVLLSGLLFVITVRAEPAGKQFRPVPVPVPVAGEQPCLRIVVPEKRSKDIVQSLSAGRRLGKWFVRQLRKSRNVVCCCLSSSVKGESNSSREKKSFPEQYRTHQTLKSFRQKTIQQHSFLSYQGCRTVPFHASDGHITSEQSCYAAAEQDRLIPFVQQSLQVLPNDIRSDRDDDSELSLFLLYLSQIESQMMRLHETLILVLDHRLFLQTSDAVIRKRFCDFMAHWRQEKKLHMILVSEEKIMANHWEYFETELIPEPDFLVAMVPDGSYINIQASAGRCFREVLVPEFCRQLMSAGSFAVRDDGFTLTDFVVNATDFSSQLWDEMTSYELPGFPCDVRIDNRDYQTTFLRQSYTIGFCPKASSGWNEEHPFRLSKKGFMTLHHVMRSMYGVLASIAPTCNPAVVLFSTVKSSASLLKGLVPAMSLKGKSVVLLGAEDSNPEFFSSQGACFKIRIAGVVGAQNVCCEQYKSQKHIELKREEGLVGAVAIMLEDIRNMNTK